MEMIRNQSRNDGFESGRQSQLADGYSGNLMAGLGWEGRGKKPLEWGQKKKLAGSQRFLQAEGHEH